MISILRRIFFFQTKLCFSDVDDSASYQARQREEARQAKILDNTNMINDQFKSFDDPYYTNIADAFMKYQQPLFDKQVQEARSALPLQFANTGSSAYQRRLSELEGDILNKQTDLKSQGLDFANKQRAEVENNRTDLINLANSGADANALALQAANRASQLSQTPQFSPVADLFQKFTGAYNQYQQAKQQGYEPNTNFPSLTFGSTNKSVRNVS